MTNKTINETSIKKFDSHIDDQNLIMHLVFKSLLHYEMLATNNNSISNLEKEEKKFEKQMNEILNEDVLINLPIEVLDQTFQKYYFLNQLTKNYNSDSFINFLVSYIKKHGKNSLILFSYVDFEHSKYNILEYIKKHFEASDLDNIISNLRKNVVLLTNIINDVNKKIDKIKQIRDQVIKEKEHVEAKNDSKSKVCFEDVRPPKKNVEELHDEAKKHYKEKSSVNDEKSPKKNVGKLPKEDKEIANKKETEIGNKGKIDSESNVKPIFVPTNKKKRSRSEGRNINFKAKDNIKNSKKIEHDDNDPKEKDLENNSRDMTKDLSKKLTPESKNKIIQTKKRSGSAMCSRTKLNKSHKESSDEDGYDKNNIKMQIKSIRKLKNIPKNTKKESPSSSNSDKDKGIKEWHNADYKTGKGVKSQEDNIRKEANGINKSDVDIKRRKTGHMVHETESGTKNDKNGSTKKEALHNNGDINKKQEKKLKDSNKLSNNENIDEQKLKFEKEMRDEKSQNDSEISTTIEKHEDISYDETSTENRKRKKKTIKSKRSKRKKANCSSKNVTISEHSHDSSINTDEREEIQQFTQNKNRNLMCIAQGHSLSEYPDYSDVIFYK